MHSPNPHRTRGVALARHMHLTLQPNGQCHRHQPPHDRLCLGQLHRPAALLHALATFVCMMRTLVASQTTRPLPVGRSVLRLNMLSHLHSCRLSVLHPCMSICTHICCTSCTHLQAYWRQEKVEEPPDAARASAAIDLLREIGVPEEDVPKVIKVRRST